jgi:small-conductance mechanosensitive channel
MNLWERISHVALAGPLAAPIWIAFLMLLLSFLRRPMLRGVFRLFRIEDKTLEQSVKSKVDAPLQLLFIVLAFTPFTFLIAQPLGSIVVLVVHVVGCALLFHVLIQIVDLAIFNWYVQRRQANVAAVVRVFVLSVLYAIAAMLLLDWALGVSVLPILATSTVLTAVLGLALQDTLKNVFAGLNMSLENSFEQGDWVTFRLDSNEQWYGQIVEIGWRTTKIKTLNNNYAIIPNSKFTNHELINFNKPTAVHARTMTIPVSLNADAVNVKTTLTRAVCTVQGVLDDPYPDVMPVEVTDKSVVYQVRFWLADCAARESMTGEAMERCWQELKDLGALPGQQV